MIKTILVPTDGSAHAKKAVEFACTIAEKFQAKLVLLHVLLHGATVAELRNMVNVKRLPAQARETMERFGQIQRGAASTHGISVSVPLPDEVFEAVGNVVLDGAEAAATKRGVKVAKRLLMRGRPAESIIACADDSKANIIIMGSRGLSDLSALMVGSVSHKVSHLARCTCVTVK